MATLTSTPEGKEKIAASIAAGKYAGIGGSQAPTQAPTTASAPAPTIDVSTLSSSQKPVTVPAITPTASSAASYLTSQSTAMSDLAKEQQTKQDKLAPKVESQEATMRGYLDKLLGKGQAQVTAESDAGIPKLTQELTDITNQIESKQIAARRRIEDIQANKTGLFGGAVGQEVAKVERESARELADLSIIQNARNRNLSTAQDLVNRKIDLEYGDLKDRIEAEKYFLENNRKDLSTAEQNTLNLKIKQDERDYTEKTTLEKTKQDLIIKASENQDVPISVIQQAQKAKTPSEVARILAPYTRDVLGERIKLAQLDKIYADIAESKAKNTPQGASELKTQALTSAKELLKKMVSGEGTSAVGTSRALGLQKIPGTAPRDFEIQFNNLKSLLSLDNVKYLKGQGQVSDAERKLLSEASSKLDLAQSEEEFKSALEDINKALGNTSLDTTITQTVTAPDGQIIEIID